MASRPNNKFAVLITPAGWDAPILHVFTEQGAATATVNAIRDSSDAEAEFVGTAWELPMIATRSTAADWDLAFVLAVMRLNFERTMPGRRLLAVRDVELKTDPSGDFATGTALWAHERADTVAQDGVA